MAIRLNKVQKELNLGLSTIVEFLQKKGFEVKEDPNAVVPEEGYNMLMEECESLFITKIDGEFEADAFIKNADQLEDYKVVWESEVQEENGIKYQFLEYKREK